MAPRARVTLPKHVFGFFRIVSWRSLFVIAGNLFGAFFFYAAKLFAPLHVPIAVAFLYFALRKTYRLYRARRVQAGLLVLKKKTLRQLILYKVGILLIFGFFASWYVFSALVPTDSQIFSNRSHSEIEVMVDTDTVYAAQLVDMLTVTGDALLNNVALYKNELTVDEAESLKKGWNEFLGVAIASEGVTDVHRYFPQISIFENPDLQAQSFTISYSLYMLKFAYFHRIIDAVGLNGEVRTVLNEYSSAFGEVNSYTDVTERFFAANSFLRRTIGYLYYLLMTPPHHEIDSPEYRILLEVAGESQEYLMENVLSHLTDRSIAYTHGFNDVVTGVWLPVQKTVFVDTIGNMHVGDRTEKFITHDDIAVMKRSLQPGDIFLARKNWYASNVGIPGFWTHAGLYTGTLGEMEKYFANLFPFTHDGVTYETFETFMARTVPGAYRAYQTPDAQGFLPAVIESETKGVGIHSLEYTAHVDYFGVVRPNIPKRDLLLSLMRAFAHEGKLYDYEFSLTTKDEIFCSELVYDAYVPMRAKAGITFPTSVVSGMELVAPNDIMKKFVEERSMNERDLSFVYFLDGIEAQGVARIANEAAFVESYSRPKFSFLQE